MEAERGEVGREAERGEASRDAKRGEASKEAEDGYRRFCGTCLFRTYHFQVFVYGFS